MNWFWWGVIASSFISLLMIPFGIYIGRTLWPSGPATKEDNDAG